MKNMETVKSIYAAFGRGDLESILAAQHADASWAIAGSGPYSGNYRGKEAIGLFFGKLIGAVEMSEFLPERFVDGGDTVVVLGSEQLIAKNTGKRASNRWVHVWTLRDGQVASFEEHFDTASVQAAFSK